MEKSERKITTGNKFNKLQECKAEVEGEVEFIYCTNYVKKKLSTGLMSCRTRLEVSVFKYT